MFVTWLFISALLCYAIMAYLWSPSLQQLQKEYEDAESNYGQRKTVFSVSGMLVNRLHYKIVCHRKMAIAVISVVWLVMTIMCIILIKGES